MNAAAMRMLTDEELVKQCFPETDLEKELVERLDSVYEDDDLEVDRLNRVIESLNDEASSLEDEVSQKETELEDMETKVHDLRDRLISSVRMSSDSLRLALGEMTAQELRTVQAVLAMIERSIEGEFKAAGFGEE